MGNRNEGLNYIIWYVMPIERKKKCIQERFKPLKVKHWKKQSLPQICNVNVYPLKEITKKRVKTMLYAIIWHDR